MGQASIFPVEQESSFAAGEIPVWRELFLPEEGVSGRGEMVLLE
jgi:hypothetical protein